MPELPEVETYVRQLRPQLLGRTFTAAEVIWPRTVAAPEVEDLRTRLVGQKIEEVGRRGKYLRFSLSSGDHLLIHLKMSGRLRVEESDCPRQPHDRVAFALDNGQELRFNDMRKFGRVYLVETGHGVTAALGPEPLDDEFTLEEFAARLRKRPGIIKSLLLNQSFLAGVGNIYADEALYRARIHPLRKANRLHDDEIEALYRAIREVLQRSIECQGTHFDFVYTGGVRESTATYQSYLQVYQRTGESCPRCGHVIERIVVGGRGTHFCPECQRRCQS